MSDKRTRTRAGVEQQCRLKCDGCGVVLGYRPTPMGDPAPFLYLLPDALFPATHPADRPAGPGPGCAPFLSFLLRLVPSHSFFPSIPFLLHYPFHFLALLLPGAFHALQCWFTLPSRSRACMLLVSLCASVWSRVVLAVEVFVCWP